MRIMTTMVVMTTIMELLKCYLITELLWNAGRKQCNLSECGSHSTGSNESNLIQNPLMISSRVFQGFHGGNVNGFSILQHSRVSVDSIVPFENLQFSFPKPLRCDSYLKSSQY